MAPSRPIYGLNSQFQLLKVFRIIASSVTRQTFQQVLETNSNLRKLPEDRHRERELHKQKQMKEEKNNNLCHMEIVTVICI
jgi:hypothetical protein